MEKLLLIIAIISFALSASIFILVVLKYGMKGSLQNRTTKIASILFFVYVISIGSFLIISN
ncbi:hypothetical protein ABFV99_19865 [Cytobacillus horneckiae]|uniref:hypothetical protein n=1 Tax=Cytobacillus horneckiae TaxID=549687 RepID=UPI0034CFCAA2